MSARAKVLVAEKIGDSGIELLGESFEVDLGVGWTRQELAERIGDYDGILIRSATKLDADLIARATRLRTIGRAGVGVDNVDLAAATKHGIVVANAPQSNVITAAEHTLALLLALARNVPQAHASLIAGSWERSKFSGVELYEKTLGILGFGRIGRAVAARAKGFSMKVLYAQRTRASEADERALGARRVELDELFAESDIVSVHCPLTEATRGIVSAERLARMRTGSVLVNTARGACVDEAAVALALASGRLGAAALDVYVDEPRVPPELLASPRAVLTPHIGSADRPTREAMARLAVEGVLDVLAGRAPRHRVV